MDAFEQLERSGYDFAAIDAAIAARKGQQRKRQHVTPYDAGTEREAKRRQQRKRAARTGRAAFASAFAGPDLRAHFCPHPRPDR